MMQKSLKFMYEWRQQMWRHNLTFGVILWNILIGLMFSISTPSLVGKESHFDKPFGGWFGPTVYIAS